MINLKQQFDQMIYKEFLVRPATNDDMNAVKNVIFSCLKEFGLNPEESGKDMDLDNIEGNYFSHNGFFGVAVTRETNEIVGTFGLFPIIEEICELRKMYLKKELRGKGLGRFILAFAIDIAKKKRFKKIVLETISPLKAAISLYKLSGFKEIEPKEINTRVDQAFELEL